jgi:TRAP-type C4-dicarboxylate transport system permease small subunit
METAVNTPPSEQSGRADRIADAIERGLNLILAAMLLVMTVSVIWQVFGRYVVGRAPGWSEEVARYLMVWITMIGSAAVLRTGGHITVTVLVDRLHAGTRRIVLLVRDLAVVIAAGVMVWYGYEFAELNSFQDSAALEIPMSVTYAALWIGPALVLLVLLLIRLGRRSDWTSPGDQT